MNDPPPPTAEGELIRQARDLAIPRLSIRAAATRIGMSPEHWGNIERGYRYAKQDEPPRPFAAPAPTIAKMASAVGVTPDQLTDAGREDAARMLEEIRRRESTPLPRMTPELEAATRPHLAEIQARVEVASHAYAGKHLTGSMIFPTSAGNARRWDMLRDLGYTVAQVTAMVAVLRADDDEKAGVERGYGVAVGLGHA